MSNTNRTNADHLRHAAARLLEFARKTDGLAPYLICHRHEYGETQYLAHFDRPPTQEMAASILQAEFEPERDEYLSISEAVCASALAGAPAGREEFRQTPLFLDVGINLSEDTYLEHPARISLSWDLIDRLEAACLLCAEMKFASIDLDDVDVAVLADGAEIQAKLTAVAGGFRITTAAGHDSGLLRPEYLRQHLGSYAGEMGTPLIMAPLSRESCSAVESDLAQSIDIDDVAEWVGQHYMRNFETEPAERRLDWIIRYLESHAQGQALVHSSKAGAAERSRA